jgi:hypothetical protein
MVVPQSEDENWGRTPQGSKRMSLSPLRSLVLWDPCLICHQTVARGLFPTVVQSRHPINYSGFRQIGFLYPVGRLICLGVHLRQAVAAEFQRILVLRASVFPYSFCNMLAHKMIQLSVMLNSKYGED